jgi:hypothetical protein
MDIGPLIRDLAVLLHLLALAAAMMAVAWGDLALFGFQRLDTRLLSRALRIMVPALVLLWLSGLAIVALDLWNGRGAPWPGDKLLAKLSVAAVLTLNGVALHRWVFPQLARPVADIDGGMAARAALLGAVSQVSWLVAMFIGVARAWAPLLGYRGLMGLYLAALLLGLAVAWYRVRPALQQRMAAPCGT